MSKAYKLSRRRFLTKTLASTAALTYLSSSYAQDLAATPTCKPSTIPTRLFSSSNTAWHDERTDLALARMACAGFNVQNPEIVGRQYLRFAGTDGQRIADLQNIATGGVEAPKLLLGVRGGYGAMRLLPHVDWTTLGRVLAERGTITAGFSDVTAVQCALQALGSSDTSRLTLLQAPMLFSEFGKATPDKTSCLQFVNALTNPNLTLEVTEPHPDLPLIQDHKNTLATPRTGEIWGGNLSILASLAGTKYLPNPDGGIVFLEDVGEPPYRLERMLYSLYLNGAFERQQAIVLGAFSSVGADGYDERYNLNAVISHLHRLTGLPVVSGVPFGHVAGKHSLPMGADCTLSLTGAGYLLAFANYATVDRGLINEMALWV